MVQKYHGDKICKEKDFQRKQRENTVKVVEGNFPGLKIGLILQFERVYQV